MTSFMINYLFSNCILALAIGILFAAKRIFRNCLSGQMHYHLWFLILALMVIPFLPFSFDGYRTILSVKNSLMEILTKITPNDITGQTADAVTLITGNSSNPIQDFAISIQQKTPSYIGTILFAIWTTGIFIMLIRMIRSFLHLYQIKKSALPLQNLEIQKIYDTCLSELKINKNIPVYSTAFLKSPALFGCFKPCIIFPHHIISNFEHKPLDFRHIFLHELQHDKHKDNFVNIGMNIAEILYWFNPLVHIALKQMQTDREIACDTAVLQRLQENEYQDYGATLLCLAEKLSFMPSPFAIGMNSTRNQLKQRIVTIASYKMPTRKQYQKGLAACAIITITFLVLIPALPAQASNNSYYSESLDAEYRIYGSNFKDTADVTHKKDSSDNAAFSLDKVSFADSFGGMEGAFVLYDTNHDTWHIYNETLARTRFSPVSTYKIYDALLALEQGILSPENTFVSWDGTSQPFDKWEQDQTLPFAMQNSVNWYFQHLDTQMGINTIQNFLNEINYGNKTTGTDLSTYWGNGSLTISPIEQVKFLKQFNQNELPAEPQNTATVKEALRITDSSFNSSFDSSSGILYGKTGTARISDKDVNGWFIGFIETDDNTFYFAAFIQAENGATGGKAAEITQEIFNSIVP